MRKPAIAIAILAAGIVGCKKDTGPSAKAGDGGGATAAATAEADTLWALAPSTATVGGVFTGHALVLADRGLAFVYGIARSIPGGEEMVEEITEFRGELLGGAASYADAGLALDRGAAFFFDGRGKDPRSFVAVVPVADRDKFVATHRGRRNGDTDLVFGDDVVCKPIGKVYACARDAADLVLGGGTLGKSAGVRGVRGDAEFVITLPELPPDVPFAPTGPLTIAVGIERGQAIARANLPAKLSGPLAALAAAKPIKLDIDRASGFIIAPLDTLAPLAMQLPLGAEVRAAVGTIAGPLRVLIPAGVNDADVRVQLSDPAPVSALLAGCGELSNPYVPVHGAPDACTIGPVPQFGVGATVWLEGKELRAARERGTPPPGVATAPPTAIARELVGSTLAFWGRGSIIGAAPAGIPDKVRLPLAAFSYLSELGIGGTFTADGISALAVLRTLHTNPDPVIKDLEAAIGAGANRAKLEEIAKANPGSPIAADAAAGAMGLTAPAAGFATLGVLSIRKKVADSPNSGFSPSEGDLMINRISKMAKTHYVMMSSFPVGKTKLTPATPCCDGPDHQCAPDPAAWSKDPVWTELELSIEEPHRFRYRYEGTKTEFTATAVGDLDCDTSEIQITAHGTLDPDGTPVVTFTKTGTD